MALKPLKITQSSLVSKTASITDKAELIQTARLETDPPPAGLPVTNMTGPNIFPMVFLRSWRPPTRFADLKYHERPRSPVRR